MAIHTRCPDRLELGLEICTKIRPIQLGLKSYSQLYLIGIQVFRGNVSNLLRGISYMHVTNRISEFIQDSKLDDYPEEAIQAAKTAIIDCFGCMLAGSQEQLARVLIDYVSSEGGNPVSTAVGMGISTTASNAALVNGATAHALDYDDITHVSKTHPTAVLLPAVTALCEESNARGRDLLLSYITGFEVACSVSETLSPAYYDDLGWHPTGPIGSIGAGASAAKMMNLSKEEIDMTVSLAASQGAGLRQNFGSMTKPFHAGSAAASGVVSAKLVSRGFTASHNAIEGEFGFSKAFSGGKDFNPDVVLDNLGKKCYLLESGLEIKKYPCCGSAHIALDAVFGLLKGTTIDVAQIKNIEVLVDFDPPRSLVHSRPKNALEGKFSMEYCLSAALLDKKVVFDSFTDDRVLRGEAQDLIPKIFMKRIPGNEGLPSWMEGYNELTVSLSDGTTLSSRAFRQTTGALRGVTIDDVDRKFLDCAGLVLEAGHADEALGLLKDIESLQNLDRLMDILRGIAK